MSETNHIYLDHGASTPVLPQVVEAMLPFWTTHYGNPSSSHEYGRIAAQALDRARRMVADLLNAHPTEIIFTGCGSESDNLALRGVMWAARAAGRGNHLITCCVEHEAVLQTAAQLRDHFGFEVTVLPVNEYGRIELAALEAAVRPNTALISIMAANNEVGSLQPIAEIGAIARQHGIPFHTDAVQAAVCTRWNMADMPVDLISFSPHKFYGPKGVGILYARRGVDLLPAQTGGGHEDGRRSGTVNVAFAVGAAEALRLATAEMDTRVTHYRALRDRLIAGVQEHLPQDAMLTGHPTQRLPHNASFAFRNVNGNDLLMHLDMASIAASSGSACKTGSPKPSAVLQAMGLSPEWATGGLRLTVGMQTSEADVAYVLQTLPLVIKKLQQLHAMFA